MVSEVRWRSVFPPLTIGVALAAFPIVDDDSANVSRNSSASAAQVRPFT
jgi:hypothetical protein